MSSSYSSRRAFLRTVAAGAGGILVAPSLLDAMGAWTQQRHLIDTDEADGWDRVPGILARIVPPTFRTIDFVVTKYGARGDGITDCSDAIRRAIADGDDIH